MFPGHCVHYPQSLWLLSWDSASISALSTPRDVCVCAPFLSTCSFGCHWVGSRHQGRGVGNCVHMPRQRWCDAETFPTNPPFWGLIPAIFRREFWSPLRLFIYLYIFLSTPTPKERASYVQISLLEKVLMNWGDELGHVNWWFHDHSSWNKNQALFLRTHRVAEHHRVHFPGLWSLLWAGPGQSQSVHPFFPYNSWVTNVSFREFQVNNK